MSQLNLLLAVIVGGTGSGKSWTVANILEKATNLKSINSIVFDLHGEYKPLKNLPNTTLLKIAGPSDKPTDENIIFLPYWLLSYEEIEVFNVLLNIFLSFPLLSSNVPTKFTFMIFSTRESGSLLSSILSATAFLIILEIKPIIFSPGKLRREHPLSLSQKMCHQAVLPY
jgi:hypothetical protein